MSFLFDSRFLKIPTGLLILVFALMIAVSVPVFAGYSEANKAVYTADGTPARYVRASLSSVLGSRHLQRNNVYISGLALRAFYESRNNKPLWVNDEGLSQQGMILLHTLKRSWTHGLSPDSYHVSTIEGFKNTKRRARKAQLELLLSDGLARYGRDLSGMRVNAESLKLNAADWKPLASPQEIFGILASHKDISGMLEAVEPQGKAYKAMRKALIRLSETQEYKTYEPVDFGGGLMKPGWNHKGVLALRARLNVPRSHRSPYIYDQELVNAVSKFQRENGLDDDGMIGDKTLQLLNRTHQDKMLQLIANMERMRWLHEDHSERFVKVNIPSAMLYAYKDGGKLDFEMPVIVGSPWRRTQSFKTEIRGVRLNPTWTIPATIKRFDILPKIQKDFDYIEEKNISLFDGYGPQSNVIPAHTVNWDTIADGELQKIRMVMSPGDHNPLGRVRILMPNKYNMYLHDTNHPELFEKADRTLSSGCMRLSEPEKMAQWVMKGQKDWSTRKMKGVFRDGEKTDLYISNRIPVTTTYHTAWTDKRGQVVFGTDVYNYDPKLIAQLEKINGFSLPKAGSERSFVDEKVASLTVH